MPRGVAALTELRDGVYRTIRQRRGEFERELSPHWRGHRRRHAGRWPSACRSGRSGSARWRSPALMYLGFTFPLAGMSDVAFAELFGAAAARRRQVARVAAAAAPPPPPPAPRRRRAQNPARPKLHQFLEPEIKAGLVQVLEDAQSVTVRLTNRNMFGSGAGRR